MNVYSIGVLVHATVYIKADTAAGAAQLAKNVTGCCLEVGSVGLTLGNDVTVSDQRLDDPTLPILSLSPAMTIGLLQGPIELSEENVK